MAGEPGLSGRVPSRPRAIAWARLGLAAGVVVIRLPTLTEPRWYSDEGFFSSIAWALSKGMPLYARVYDNSPPGIYWIYRGLLALGAGEHHYVVQLATTAAVMAAALLTFEVARRVAGLRPALLAGGLTALAMSLPTLDGDLLNVEMAALPFFLAALLLALKGGRPASLASGALLGAALLIRPSFAFDGLALLVALLSVRGGRPARVALTGLGILAVLGTAALALALQGSLASYQRVVMPSDHAYLLWANRGTLNPLYARLGALGAASLIGLARSRSSQARLLSVWLPASLVGASLTPRELTHYVHEVIPPLAVLAAVLAVQIRWRWLAAPAAVAGVLVAAEAALILPARQTALMSSTTAPSPLLHNFAFRQLPGYYGNWAAYVSGREPWSTYVDGFPGPKEPREADVAALRRLAAASGAHTLLVLGDRPWLYIESGLRPATAYIGLNSAFWTLHEGPRQIHAALARDCAALVILSDDARGWRWDLRDDHYLRVSGGPWPIFRPPRPPRSCHPST
ncbi:MAG: glycosyltransferase family 39 protein [Candidatus Dormibacteraceae bacterium]